MFTFRIIVSSLTLGVCFGAIGYETAPVSDAQKANGFSCNSRRVGLMKFREKKDRFKDKCLQYTCINGVVILDGCAEVQIPCALKLDYSKPFPYCCKPLPCTPPPSQSGSDDGAKKRAIVVDLDGPAARAESFDYDEETSGKTVENENSEGENEGYDEDDYDEDGKPIRETGNTETEEDGKSEEGEEHEEE